MILMNRRTNISKAMKGASDRLVFYKVDLLDTKSLSSVVKGCDGIFYVVSPITEDPVLMVQSIVEATGNVIKAASKIAIKRVVFTPSIGVVMMGPKHRNDVIILEQSRFLQMKEKAREISNQYPRHGESFTFLGSLTKLHFLE
ncbi:hypothetical protein KSP39_PZI019326 [Platanthera zijinensis]|uniref:NAD(P)-binding domain-containing protein n=1 Tax=Platanthera zijinensis TaxID=2320716 RepID=A0AAP0B0Z4_9ASPA